MVFDYSCDNSIFDIDYVYHHQTDRMGCVVVGNSLLSDMVSDYYSIARCVSL